MKKIAVVYWSGSGNTEAMANAIAQGAKDAGAQAELFTPAAFDESKVADYDVLALGCSSQGSEELEDTEFEPMLARCEPALAAKPVALFGSYGWGDGEWMRSWEARCREKGIALTAESLIINETPDDEGLAKCRALGETLAQ